MKFLSILSTLVAATVAANINASLPVPRSSSSLSDIKNGTFTQYLDHEHPEKGTFQQHYWWNAKWFQGPGSPVILYTPGEQNASSSVGALTNASLPGYLAQELGGAAILIEHRYWGESAPYKHMNAETLQYLTVKQAIADFVHFAKTVDLEFDEDNKSNADKSPWIITGASYSGALSAWIEKTAPGTFWAYHASSAPVEAIYDYSQYYLPIKEGLPKNCSTDIGRVVNFIDAVYESSDDAAVQKIKDLFGLGDLKYFDDFASAISQILGVWQSEDLSTGEIEYSPINEFCDAIENVNNKTTTLPGADGVGLEKALQGYATFYKNKTLPTACQDEDGPISVYCLDTHDLTNPMYEDSGEARQNRLWQWMLCNDNLFYWQTGNQKISLISQTITPDYYQRQCSLHFPPRKRVHLQERT